MTPLADQQARERIRGDLDTTLVVEAAAGTGKTTELVTRMVAALVAGRAQLGGIVAVTFTEPAAGELKLRLRSAIERERESPDCPAEARARLVAALPQLEEARIGTIHSFCADLLRERPVEAGVDPLFEVAANETTRPLFDRAFDRWFDEQLRAPSAGVTRILRRQRSERGRGGAREQGPRALLKNAAWALVERRDFPARWRHDEGFEREREIDQLLETMTAVGGRAGELPSDDWFTRSLLEIQRFLDEVRRRETLGPRDYDGLEAALAEIARGRRARFWNWKGWRAPPELREARDRLHERLLDFVDRAGADLAPRLRDELWAVVEEYERLKERAGSLDFLDLLIRARSLVRDDARVRTELQRDTTHIFVDEFQDTDPLQAEILLLLAADDPAESDWRRVRPRPGKLFVVGDPKQSIYRFRRADVALYEAVKRQILDSGGARVELTVSFRAVPEIQRGVNAAFAPRMTGEPGRPGYVPLAPFREDPAAQPAIVALPIPAPYGDFRRIVSWRIEESLPEAVAAFIQWLVQESGWTVTEATAPERRVPVEPRHVCLLFRRVRSYLTDVTRPYVRALEARRLPHLLVGGTSFHVREEVEAIRNALSAVERPDDELSVFATLRGPLFAFGDGALLAFRERTRSFHTFRRAPDDLPPSLAEIAGALEILRELHVGRNRRPIADTISRLLSSTRAHAGFAIWPTGEQALANITRLLDLARRFERAGGVSFRGFVDWLTAEAESGEAGDAPIVEEGTGGVRIMTVHRAKGLEFPVVVLADPTANPTPSKPSRWVDGDRGLCAMPLAGCAPPELREHEAEEMEREREEADRVLYVAATRARDLLVVPAVGDERQEGWIATLNPILYPPLDRCRAPEDHRPPGCPELGGDSTFRPANVSRPTASVSPGRHRAEIGDHRVVWWDPWTLRLSVQETVGLAQQTLLQEDETGERSREGVRAHAEWQEARQQLRERASTPTLRVTTATELAAEKGVGSLFGSVSEPALTDEKRLPTPFSAVESVPIDFLRPRGKRFGTLVHALLADVDLDAPREVVAAAGELHGRVLGATRDEVAQAVESVTRALEHPLLRRAARAISRRRETPVVLRLDDGRIVEGVVDLAFAEDGGWTVVDFKTDAEIGGRLDEYRRQVALYALATERATGEPATGVLLRV